MDCEKFEDAIMDELYGELDEVTSAAVRRHASGCAKCADRLASLRATRKVLASSFESVPLPAGLEDRIFAATRDAAPPTALRVVAAGGAPDSTTSVAPARSVRGDGERRVTRLVSMAGRWAMRPQTAMAAVFLLMIGSSVLLMRGRSSAPSAVVVTERGAPADNEADDKGRENKSDPAAAANAHGAESQPGIAMAATATAAPAPAEAAKESPRAESAASAAIALAEPKADRDRAGRAAEQQLDRKPSDGVGQARTGAALGPSGAADSRDSRSDREFAMADSPAPVAAAPGAPAPPARPKAAARSEPQQAQPATPPPSPPQTSVPQQQQPAGGTGFADGMAAYRSQRYADALSIFDGLAAQGDSAAALWAARSEREASGCAKAVARLDKVAAVSYGTTVGYDASLEAGRCYRQLGSFEAARGRFARLLTVPSHAPRAQAEIDAMTPQRTRQAAPAKPSSNQGQGL